MRRGRRVASPPGITSARWGVKGTSLVTDERGQRQKERLHFYGYKQHVGINAQTGLITSIRASPGSAYDVHFLPSLLESDLEQEGPVGIVACPGTY